jgi:hypothetical protein
VHSNAGYQVPAGQSVSVVIQDTDQKAVYHKTLATSATGTIHDDIPLPTDASLGYYSIQLKAGEDQMDGDFEVQEYKKPEYEVRVQAAKPRVIQGDSASVGFDARYYFGEPVAGRAIGCPSGTTRTKIQTRTRRALTPTTTRAIRPPSRTASSMSTAN